MKILIGSFQLKVYSQIINHHSRFNILLTLCSAYTYLMLSMLRVWFKRSIAFLLYLDVIYFRIFGKIIKFLALIQQCIIVLCSIILECVLQIKHFIHVLDRDLLIKCSLPCSTMLIKGSFITCV